VVKNNDDLESAKLPALKEVYAFPEVSFQYNPELTSIDLHSLYFTSALLIGSNPALITLDLASLQEVGDIVIYSYSLQHFDLSSLSEVSLAEFSILAPVVLPRLSSVDFLGIAHCKTPRVELPALFDLRQASIFINEELTTIEMPALTNVSGSIEIHDNPVLANLSMPAFVQCHTRIEIHNNSSLCASVLDSVLDQWRDDESCTLHIAGNGSGC